MARRLIPKFFIVTENVGRGVLVSGLFHSVLLGGVVLAAPELFGDDLTGEGVPITIQIFEDVYEVAEPEVPAAPDDKPEDATELALAVPTAPLEPETPKALEKPEKAPEITPPDVTTGAIEAAAKGERPADSGPAPVADGSHDVAVVYERGPALSRIQERGLNDTETAVKSADGVPVPTELREIKAEIRKLEVLKGQAKVERKIADAQKDKQAAEDAAAQLRELANRLKQLEVAKAVAETKPEITDPAKPRSATQQVAAKPQKPLAPKAAELPDPPKPKLSASEILKRNERRTADTEKLDAEAVARAKKTLKRMRQAAKEGIPSAQMNVAKALDKGKGVKQDKKKATQILERLARRNYQPAQLELAKKLLTGDGVRKDQKRAYVLLKTAAEENNIVAKRALRSLSNELTEQERKIADKEAGKVRRQIQKQRAENKLSTAKQQELDDNLRVAIDKGNVQRIESLLRSGADPNAIDASGKDAIIAASWRGREMVVEFLVDKGVDIDAIDLEGRTPLAWASINGYRTIVDILLAQGADPNALDDDGKTPLMRAAWNGHRAVVQILLDRGASPAITDSDGKTALDRAREEDWQQVVQLLEPLTRAN